MFTSGAVVVVVVVEVVVVVVVGTVVVVDLTLDLKPDLTTLLALS